MLDIENGRQFRVVSHGMLGYGFPIESMHYCVQKKVDLIAVDAGSSDPGPFYLGSNNPLVSDESVARDLSLFLDLQEKTGAKIVIGSAGGGGTNAQVGRTLGILRDQIRAKGLQKKVAIVRSEIDKPTLRDALRKGDIEPFETQHDLREQDIEESEHIVAQIGVEPIVAALSVDPDIVICGRAWDPANIAALPISLGYDAGLCIHAGKILECGALAALPPRGSDLLIGTIYDNAFVIEPCGEDMRCTVESVSAHTLYEKTNPTLLPGPGGISDLRESEFTQLDERRVRVSGSRFRRGRYQVKLEGARFTGWRRALIGGIRDPLMIEQIDSVQKGVMARLSELYDMVPASDYRVAFHRYGKDGVMGSLEPMRATPHEIGLLIDVVGKTEAIANLIAAALRALILHWPYNGRIATAGNLAFPFSPAELTGGPVYEFSVYHLMNLGDPKVLFPFEIEIVG